MKYALSLLALLISAPYSGFALDVSSPYVKEGIVELEWKNRLDADHRRNEGGYKRHSISANYGVNRYLSLELGSELEDIPHEGYGLRSTEVEATFQLAPRGAWWVDSGLRFSYQQSHQPGEADEVATRLLLARQTGDFRHLLNIIVEQQVGDFANENPTGELRLSSRYQWMKTINPGLEYYAEFNEWTNTRHFDNQRHRAGVAFYGRIADGVSYETGALFGLSERAEDVLLKFNLDYEFSL